MTPKTTYTPCCHLDYEGEYTDCVIATVPSHPEVRYWVRGPLWTGQENTPINVQFCKLRGRINSMFDCYAPGAMGCYVAASGTGAHLATGAYTAKGSG